MSIRKTPSRRHVSWPEYLRTRERLRANVRPRGEGGGAARQGAALLQGLCAAGGACRSRIRQVRRLLGEHHRAGQRPRPTELGGHDPAPTGLAVADLVARLEEVELQ
jgi:hypothetical protein